MKKVCDAPTDSHPFSLSVLGKVLEALTLFRSKESMGGKWSLWVALDEHGEKSCILARSNHQRGVSSSCLTSGQSKGGSGKVSPRRSVLLVV